MIYTLLAQNIGGSIDPIGAYGRPGDAAGASANLSNFVSNILTFLTVMAGISFILYFVLGALKWITAGGDSNKVDGAKSQMTNAAIGIIAVVASYGIAAIISTVLGLNILNPGTIIENLGPKPSAEFSTVSPQNMAPGPNEINNYIQTP